ncbi:hypothetical protein [Streptomyces sp. 1222.5]|uniref:hypothetical protein n=1 Tax=Streptomyces sp. 1222.5 TaxID=1881026 RepID=UPI003EBF8176
MEFQFGPGVAHLFADATAAFMRGKADTVWLNEQSEEWNELWLTFRDADTASVTVSYEAGRLMFWVWGARWAWRDEATRRVVAAELRPQWQEQMRQRVTR